ncbi:hypothetical protein L218DRAFT_856810 [Marasmius fiardii PR-910]|nr:hypothetical protein L218DRAFT_856810 [Marasmius fiardii PR-910]
MPHEYTPSNSPRGGSMSPSETSHHDDLNGLVPPSPRAGSPPLLGSGGQHDELFDAEDTVTCLWDNCGVVFTHLPTLIEHIHNDHIGVHKSNYTCEWATCHRRGLSQTSRFALISHIRSHTGEKPFICPLPECDKSFTRSDALAKHMRLQHNIEPPAPGRGGSRKRKRDETNSAAPAHGGTPPPAPQPNYEEPDEADIDYENFVRAMENGYIPQSPGGRAEDEGTDTIPPALMTLYDPASRTILGRSKEMVMYLLMKAKLRYALEQQGYLLEELRSAKVDLRREQEDKERMVDTFLRGTFGYVQQAFSVPYAVYFIFCHFRSEADAFILPLQPPENPHSPRSDFMPLVNGSSH